MKNYIVGAFLLAFVAAFSASAWADSNGDQIERSSMTVRTPLASTSVLNSEGVPKLAVEFAPNRWDLPTSSASLRTFGQYLQSHPASRAEIIAYADHTGHGPANALLSQKRADAVAQYLESNYAISADRISAKGYGEIADKAHNITEANRQADRQAFGTIKP